jgi:polyvinyl alcohol dehydrogenase (cytochrome)
VAIAHLAWTQAPGSPTPAQDLAHAQGTNLGIFTFTGRCGGCHDSGKNSAPDRYTLNRYTPEEVLATMTTGSMAPYAKGLSALEMRVVAVYIGGRTLGSAETGDASAMKGRCAAQAVWTGPSVPAGWNGWGHDLGNTRFQSSPGLSADQLPQLHLKWAFGFPQGNSAYGQPAVVNGRVFIGADTGFVYSLAADTGCRYWSFKANAGVRTAISVGPSKLAAAKYLAFFGDIKGNVYAVNAETGALIWSQRADKHPIARITGAPTLDGDRLYVPVSSLEESGAGNPSYSCCTFRGSIVAYDANTGKQLWKSFTIAEEPKPIKKTSKGTQLWAPAGAGVWSSPTIDVKRHAVYVATGNGYTEPAVDTSDAVLAFDLRTGKRLWAKQLMANDSYVRDCPGKYRPNVPVDNKSETCPDDLGPDMDFGNAPILKSLSNGRSLIVIGQKDGHAWALDADREGTVVWQRMVGMGIDNGGGGMQWGSAADDHLAYFPVTRGGPKLGLAALNLETGEVVWRATPSVASSAPASVIPEVVFSGSNAGTMYAYSTSDGHVLWQYDTAHEFATVNGVEARGGGLGGGAGPVVAEGKLFVTSGYADLFGGPQRGNVLLAFGFE